MKTTTTHNPTVSGRPAVHHGSMSTAEIKARIEAMFADDRPQPRPTSH
ncbi:hypothetical protein [Rhodococcus opacus]|nr:hypothetical protein [Rhodococcus opacus]